MATATIKSVVRNDIIVEKSDTEHSNAQSRESTGTRARARRATAKEAREAKDRECQDLATRAVALIWPGSAQQRARAAKGSPCQRHGASGDRPHSLDLRRSSGDSGCPERAQRREKAKGKESPASAS